MLIDITVPDQFKHCKNIRKFAWPQMSEFRANGTLYLSVKMEMDTDSDMGKALFARGDKGKEDAQHDLAKSFAGGLYPNSFGIYSQGDKSSSETIRTDIPQDEKYHWYKIPAWDFQPGSFLWGFYWYSRVDLSSAWTNADGLPGYNVWETWFSVKYTGPAYVKGSTRPNGVWIDKVILVKPEEMKK